MNVLGQAMKYLKVNVDLDELECIVIEMINENFVKGYVSHQYQTIVLSKRMPFPRLAN